MAAMGCDKFVEVGSGKVLTGLMKRNAPEAAALSIGNPGELEAFLKTL
jgi:[acyl-carrier-protein] S-malonyltransferase